MIKQLWAIDEFYKSYQEKADQLIREIEDMGYPNMMGGGAAVPYDSYSDFLRGSMFSLSDLYDRPKEIERYIEESFEQIIAGIKASKGINEGKHVFMALHKGMDGFMSDEHYRKYYWRHLQQIILAIIDSGKIPFV